MIKFLLEKVMDKRKSATLLSVFVMLMAAMVMAGWILDIAVLKSVLSVWVTIKFSAALCFLISGIIVISIVWMKKYPVLAQISLSMTTMMWMLFMMGVVFPKLIGNAMKFYGQSLLSVRIWAQEQAG